MSARTATKMEAGVVWLAGVGLLLALGCASDSGTRAHWVRLDGTTPPQAELQAAASRCEEKVPRATGSRPRWNSVEWGVQMVDCLEDEGYVMVPKEDGALGEGG